MLWNLNHVAVANISQFGGRLREEPIYVGTHKPPHFNDVPHLMDQFISTVHENWYLWNKTELAAYGLWRLNWIHPFIEGNGRTARAASYYLLCVKSGGLIGGRKIIPEGIRENPTPYYEALEAADRAWEIGNLDFSVMEDYLAGLLMEQLQDDDGLPHGGDPMPQISN
jgi:Fic family protein